MARIASLLCLLCLLLGGWPAPPAGADEGPEIAAGNAVVLAEPGPELAAGHAAVLAEPGPVVLYDRAMRERVAPASLTKVMTALVALQRGDPAQRLTVAADDLVGQASMGLRAGERVSLATLLHGLLLPSGNDAAMTIARGLGEQAGGGTASEAVARFVGWMNEEAARLGLDDTHFVNPHGLDAPGHSSSAYDLARLALVAWQRPDLAGIAGRRGYSGEGYSLRHGHALVGRYPGVLGGKTGRTRGCRSCLLTVAERDGRRLAVVVLRSTRDAVVEDTTRLLDWAFSGGEGRGAGGEGAGEQAGGGAEEQGSRGEQDPQSSAPTPGPQPSIPGQPPSSTAGPAASGAATVTPSSTVTATPLPSPTTPAPATATPIPTPTPPAAAATTTTAPSATPAPASSSGEGGSMPMAPDETPAPASTPGPSPPALTPLLLLGLLAAAIGGVGLWRRRRPPSP